jgi:hypothetical protein
VRQAWPGSAVDHAPVWGLIELLNCQNKKDRTDSMMVAIAEILSEKWTSAGRVWPEVNGQIKAQFPQKDGGRYTQWKDHRYTNTGNRGLMIGAAIKTLIENHEAWVRSQPGRKKGFDLKLNPVTSAGGQLFEMDMPYTGSDCTKNFSRFTAIAQDQMIATSAVPESDVECRIRSTRQSWLWLNDSIILTMIVTHITVNRCLKCSKPARIKADFSS